jgi:hypothetical protein
LINARSTARIAVFVVGSLSHQTFLSGEVNEANPPTLPRLDRTSRAADVDRSAKIDSQTFDVWIEQLGDSSFQTRQQAFLNLWGLVEKQPSLRAKLEGLVEANDLETSVSIRWLRLLSKIAKPAAQALNPSFDIHAFFRDATLLRSGDLEVLFKHAKAGRWDHIDSLLSLLTTQEQRSLVKTTSSQFDPDEGWNKSFYKLLALAWNQEQRDRLPDFVDRFWPPLTALQMRREWRRLGLLDLADAPLQFLDDPILAKEWNALLQHEQRGEIDEAIEKSPELLSERLAIDYQRWPILLERSVADFENSSGGQVPPPKRLKVPQPKSKESIPADPAMGEPLLENEESAISKAKLSLLAAWSGNESQAESWAKSIGAPDDSPEAAKSAVAALVLAQRFEDAIQVAKTRAPSEAFDVLFSQGRIDEAVECLGCADRSEAAIKKFLEDTFQKDSVSESDEFEVTFRLARLGCLFQRLGDKKITATVDDTLLHWISGAGEEHRKKIEANRDRSIHDVIRSRWIAATWVWTGLHRRDFAIQKITQLVREKPDADLQRDVLRILYRRDQTGVLPLSDLADPIFRWLMRMSATKDVGQALQQLERLAAGERLQLRTLKPLSKSDDLPAIGNDVLVQVGQTLIRDETVDSAEPVARQLAELALAAKRTELAKDWLLCSVPQDFRDWYRTFLKSADVIEEASIPSSLAASYRTALLLLAKIHAEDHDSQISSKLYRHLWQMHPEEFVWAIEAAQHLEHSGDKRLARDWQQQAKSLPLSDEDWKNAVSSLVEEQAFGDAVEAGRRFLRTPRDERSLIEADVAVQLISADQDLLNKHAKNSKPGRTVPVSELLAILQDHRCASLAMLQQSSREREKLSLSGALAFAESYWRGVARLAIAQENLPLADKAIRHCHQASPEQIETPIELIPTAEKTFGPTVADAWLKLYSEPMEKHLTTWPDDTLIGNNLAWLYANVDRDLDRAAMLSQHVVELLPNDHMYLDTLAEVEFRRGNIKEAIDVAARCRELAPLENHYRHQIQRFLQSSSKGTSGFSNSENSN